MTSTEQLFVQPLPYGDPERWFAALLRYSYPLWLDSALPVPGFGRASYLACDPFLVIRHAGGQTWVNDTPVAGSPWAVLAAHWRAYRLPRVEGLPPFQTGAAGFWGYELARYLERVPTPPPDVALPDMVVAFYDVVVALDHEQRRAWVLSSGFPEQEPAARAHRARARAAWMQAAIQAAPPAEALTDDLPPVRPESNFTPEAYRRAVQRVREYILAGDIFQANLSQRFRAPRPTGYAPFALYRRLRRLNPAPYAAYFDFGEGQLLSASPERFLRVEGGWVDTRPIKGTRPRGATPAEDRRLAEELLHSEKDRAENTMIVDLLRNDLSRVCRPGTVQVPRLCGLESYATVHHLVSTVVGQLEPDRDALDLLQAAFPGGSITGAPKIRAMEIIAELEPCPRGPYCGNIGYLAFSGDMDTSIVIRTLVLSPEWVMFSVGGGIVADSDPEGEYRETLDKARALLQALDPEGRVP